jgi:4-hydroxy-2-oxoheptanedioate aldolase
MAGRAGLSWGFRPDCICAEAFGLSYYDHRADDIPTQQPAKEPVATERRVTCGAAPPRIGPGGIIGKETAMAATLRNAARERLEAGGLALGVILRQARTVDIAPIMQAAGYDWLFLDLEHNSMDLDMAVQISVAALGVGIAPIVRVPARQLWMATRVLDGGALGIVMPHVDTPEEARQVAQALRYPPLGHRSVAGGLPHFGYAKLGLAETCTAINAATLVIVMLETPTAIGNAAAIAAVPGIDSLLIGTNDLAMELGIPGAFGDERIAAAYQSVVDACRANGKFAGVGGIADRELLRRYIGMGVRLVLPGSDLGFMASAASECAAAMRAFL